eukprot:874766-Rhodomonas_salina.4
MSARSSLTSSCTRCAAASSHTAFSSRERITIIIPDPRCSESSAPTIAAAHALSSTLTPSPPSARAVSLGPSSRSASGQPPSASTAPSPAAVISALPMLASPARSLLRTTARACSRPSSCCSTRATCCRSARHGSCTTVTPDSRPPTLVLVAALGSVGVLVAAVGQRAVREGPGHVLQCSTCRADECALGREQGQEGEEAVDLCRDLLRAHYLRGQRQRQHLPRKAGV